ncbi:two-component system sensor histidine kinase CssS [Halanaerobium saccharolyticum]|uniref:histidine kinase n=1 Tax=Halanaerobium saccharolyticum TaxID=43595 RepID=A0A4V3G3U2_9FIRM|nr:HAMP domain-containing sensor histidine kinase [Halanaerobium saccharolyticum]RAK04113.1 two-component system sensor histidine kinase CssS [Halanaerobium saccharolyticum]TDV97887.1 two-component system sensor histidine kinase CssS [Halanaerobium saccharolyticum]TDX50990.1 two-component system sensor histidine kinase CssS [Halanaerobium saccharolyticum]
MKKLLTWMKNKPLAFQIWLIIGAVLVISVLFYSISLPFILQSLIISEKYDRLEETQAYIIEEGHFDNLNQDLASDDLSFIKTDKPPEKGPPVRFSRVPRHFIIDQEGQILDNDSLTAAEKIKEDILNSDDEEKRSKLHLSNNQIIYYVYQELEIEGENRVIVSYLQSRYRDSFFREFFIRLIISLLVFLILAWLISIFVARYLTRSLQIIKKQVKKIANREWDQPLKIERQDEIGELANTIEWLRQQLVERDEKQQEFIQQISHEIKTPIMVLRSYVQSMQDGIYPRGDLQGSLKAMETESFRMEKRVKTLINISKMEYLSRQNLKIEKINFNQLLENKLEKLSWRRKDVNWSLIADSISLRVDRDKFEVILENIIDNQFKYADQKIRVSIEKMFKRGKNIIQIRFWNDGPEIEKEDLKNIFDKFKKGDDGEYGLGLAISKVLVELHGGQIWAKNEDGGAAFYIEIPEEDKNEF